MRDTVSEQTATESNGMVRGRAQNLYSAIQQVRWSVGEDKMRVFKQLHRRLRELDMSYTEIAQVIGMSQPALAEEARNTRLEEADGKVSSAG